MRLFRILTAAFLMVATGAMAQSIVERRGALKVSGKKILDQYGTPIQLTGMSLYWSQWGSKFYNQGVVETLVDDWQCSVVRAAMAVDSSVGGYINKPATTLATIQKVVEAAIAKGVYVVIDWHEEMAIDHAKESADFFRMMARKYGNTPNVIFEIYNEPHNADELLDPTWAQIKEYAEIVIPAIREYSSNLVVVGTPTYSQEVDVAAEDPIDTAKYGSVAYTLHFYAGTHGSSLRSRANSAMSMGIPLFVTEWGTTTADGGQLTGASKGKVYTTESTTWLNYLTTNKISSCNWSLTDVSEGSAALNAGADAKGVWDTLVDLSASGLYVRSQIRARCAADSTVCPFLGSPAPALSVPGIVGATRFSQAMAVIKEADADSFLLGSIDDGDWAVYTVTTAATDTFEIRANALVSGPGGTISIKTDSGQISIPVQPLTTGDTWYTAYSTNRLVFPAGVSQVEVRFQGAGFGLMKLRRLEFVKNSLRAIPAPGPVASNGYSVPPTLSGLGQVGEATQAGLTMLRNGATVTYSISAPQAGTYTLSAKVASATTGGKLEIRSTGALRSKFTALVPFTGGWQNWQMTWTAIPLVEGTNSLSLTAVGDTGVALFSVTDLSLELGVGVQSKASAPGVSVLRHSGSIGIAVPAGIYREARLVAADGTLLGRADLSGRSLVEIAVGANRLPMWLRLTGTMSSRTIAVPPLR